MEVKGRDLVAGLPKTLTITSQEVREALLEPISTIVDSVRVTLERCPPELSADLVDRGLVLAGGGALLRGLDRLLMEETGLPVHIAEDPLSAVAEGTGRALSELKFLRQVATSDNNRLLIQRSIPLSFVRRHEQAASMPLPSPSLASRSWLCSCSRLIRTIFGGYRRVSWA